MSDLAQDPAAIERDVRETRLRLDQRITELTTRLTPGEILDETLGFLKTKQGMDFSRNLAESVRERPIPTALVGIGLAWLMANPRGTRPAFARSPHAWQSGDDDLVTRAWNAGRSVIRNTGETDSEYRARVMDARGKVLGVVRRAQDTAASYADRVQDTLFSARDRLADAAGVASARVSEAGDTVGNAMQDAGDRLTHRLHDWRDQAGQMGERASDLAGAGYGRARHVTGWASNLLTSVGDNPILLGALGMTAGAVLGGLLPSTEIEREYLADAASDTRAAVQDAVQDAVNRGSDVAQAAMEAGGQTLSEAAEATRDLGEKAGEHAQALGEKTQAGVRDVAEKTRASAKDVAQAARQNASEVANRAGNTAPVGKPTQ